MVDGTQHHNNRRFELACNLFTRARLIAGQLLDQDGCCHCHRILPLQISASHNLAASYSARGKLDTAGRVLEQLHHSLLHLCLCDAKPRRLRIVALGELDDSLFALTSSLGARGRFDELYEAISETELVAEQAARQLLH
jgi:hypothetical protein